MRERPNCGWLHALGLGKEGALWRVVTVHTLSLESFTRALKRGSLPACTCAQYRGRLPQEARSLDGHVTIRGSALPELSPKAHAVAAGNAKETIAPGEQVFRENTLASFRQLFKTNQITVERIPQFQEQVSRWAKRQWSAHVPACDSPGLVDARLRELR